MDYDEYFNSYMSNVISSRAIIRSVMSLLERQDDMLRLMYLNWSAQGEEDARSPVPTPAPAPVRRRTGLNTHSPIYRAAVRNHMQSPVNTRFYRESIRNNIRNQSPRNIPIRNDNIRNNYINNTIDNNNTENTIAEIFAQAILNSMGNLGQLSPVIVRPTARTIERATENILFSDIPSNIDRYQQCPISHDNFETNTPITRIRQCGHYFGRDAIATWFETSCQCPICRADIRDGLEEDEDNAHNEEIIDDDATGSADQEADPSTSDNENENNSNRNNSNRNNNNRNNGNIERNRSITDILTMMSNGLDRDNGASISYQFEFVPVVRNVTNGLPPHLTSQFDISHNNMSPSNYRTTYSRSYDLSGNNFS